MSERPLLAFYGDDVTGSAENLAQLHRHGLSCFMFLKRPSAATFVAKAQALDAVGIAGNARSLAPAPMEAELAPIFRLFAGSGARLVQYKLCSTFDSAPHVGNLATAMDVARRAFPDALLPVFAATPEFGRYTAFGNHYARFGEDVVRLDRHPAMSRHPVTPMHEADLREVLAAQGASRPHLVDLRDVTQGPEAMRERLEELRAQADAPIVFDGIVDAHCVSVAALALELSRRHPVVAFAAQGFADGFGRHLKGPANAAQRAEPLAPVDRLLVLSGSCAPQTARQIEAFAADGAEPIRVLASALLDPSRRDAVTQASDKIASAIAAGRSAVGFTAMGPQDPDVAATRERAARMSLAPADISECVGAGLAAIARAVAQRTRLSRLTFAGGDSSTYALRALDVDGLTVASGEYVTSSHVFRLYSDNAFDGVEVALKGGQVGDDRFFMNLRDGRP